MNQELVKSAVNGYQMRINELQASLSTETKMKIELYQALGDYKRQFEVQTRKLNQVTISFLEYSVSVALLICYLIVSSTNN